MRAKSAISANGRSWTVPKGHVERGETTRDAAVREAREEAGVTGDVDERPFTRYRYQVISRQGIGATICVEAYLLAVRSEFAPGAGERMRTPQWITLRDAIERLSAYRDRLSMSEHRRVIEEAVSRLKA